MKSLSIKNILLMIIVVGFSSGLATKADQLPIKMNDAERIYCRRLIALFETEMLFLHECAVSFIQRDALNEKGQKVANKIPFRQYVSDLSGSVDRFEKEVEAIAFQMKNTADANSCFYLSLVIVYDSCAKILPPLQTLRSILIKYVSANANNFMAKKIAKEIEESLSKMPLEQIGENLTNAFKRLKVLMAQVQEAALLAEIAVIEKKAETIRQNFLAMKISPTIVVASLDQKLRNNK